MKLDNDAAIDIDDDLWNLNERRVEQLSECIELNANKLSISQLSTYLLGIVDLEPIDEDQFQFVLDQFNSRIHDFLTQGENKESHNSTENTIDQMTKALSCTISMDDLILMFHSVANLNHRTNGQCNITNLISGMGAALSLHNSGTIPNGMI